MNFIQANTNGRLHDALEPSLSPLSRGFLYGDAIYEVWRTYDRVLFGWSEHWTRLHESGKALAFSIPWSEEEVLTQIQRTVCAFDHQTQNSGDVYVRLQIYRGSGAIGLDTQLAEAPGYIILVQNLPIMTELKLEKGLKLSVGRELRRNAVDTLSPAWKTGNYLNNILCLREVRARGADDVVILNQAGEVTEASTSNIAFIRNGCFITPPLSAGILAGVTRRFIIDAVAGMAGMSVMEATILPEMISAMEECLLISTTKDVQPVGRIDEVEFKVGADSQTRRLKAAFASYVEGYNRRHAGLKV